MTCNRFPQQNANVFNNNYTNNFNYTSFNRYTNINQTFINNENKSPSIYSNVTVNNYNYNKQPSIFGPKKPCSDARFNQFINRYRRPIAKIGCGCQRPQPQIGCQPQRRGVWQSFANMFRGFMNFRSNIA